MDPKVEGRILALSGQNFSQRKILSTLKSENISVSKTCIHNVIHNVGQRRQAKSIGLLSPVKEQPRKTVTPSIIKKVDILTSKENPPSQREISRLVKVSQSTVHRIIRSLNKKLRRKTRVHKLKPHHMRVRKTTCRKLYENLLAGRKWEYVVTLDEAMFGLQNCNGKRKICYIRKGEEIPEDWYVDKDNFHVTFMVVGALTGRGTRRLIRVPKKVKVNSDYYITRILKPLLEVELPKLYPGELSKITVHHDQAPSHISKKTALYAENLKAKLGITIMQKRDIPVKSPDVSPLDFFGFGFLKRQLFQRKPKTQDGVWKVLREEWSRIDQNLITKTFNSWKRRLRLVAARSGRHIENTKNIHRRFK